MTPAMLIWPRRLAISLLMRAEAYCNLSVHLTARARQESSLVRNGMPQSCRSFQTPPMLLLYLRHTVSNGLGFFMKLALPKANWIQQFLGLPSTSLLKKPTVGRSLNFRTALMMKIL